MGSSTPNPRPARAALGLVPPDRTGFTCFASLLLAEVSEATARVEEKDHVLWPELNSFCDKNQYSMMLGGPRARAPPSLGFCPRLLPP